MPPTTATQARFRKALINLRQTIGSYLDEKSSDVQHRDVIKELYSRTDMTGSYLAALVFANLIALLGLLSNSVAVVIGAMLISPLMGPIFSMGLSFAMGNLVLARKAARIIGLSVLVTVAVAALLTLLSPLKEATPEILARTRPNIYDLFVAIFAGAIGAIALCTRKNYLFTTTGIAIATAVIPPLSVVGYGIGTLQLALAMGGFLLFFTNLVAIVISSDIVFMLLRFRSSMVVENSYPLNFRLKTLGITLLVISIPLVTTLVTDIQAFNLSKRIEATLKSHLNLEGHSRLTGFSLSREEEVVKVLASVNTVREIDAITEKKLKNALIAGTKRPVKLELEQVLVKAGTIKPQQAPIAKKILATPAEPPKETLASLRGKTMAIIKETCDEAGSFLAPWPVRNCEMGFSAGVAPVTLHLTIGRDFAVSQQEQRWLVVALEKKLDHPVTLKTEFSPLLPDLNIADDGVPDEAGKKALGILKEIGHKDIPLRLTVNYPAENRKKAADSLKKARLLKQFLVQELGMPADRINLKASGTTFRILVMQAGQG